MKSPDGRMHSPRKEPTTSSQRQTSNNNQTSIDSPPVAKSKTIYSDRFIPSRVGSQFDTAFSLLDEPRKKRRSSGTHDNSSRESNTAQVSNPSSTHSQQDAAAFSLLLRSELLGVVSSPRHHHHSPRPESSTPTNGTAPTISSNHASSTRPRMSWSSNPMNLFRFQSPVRSWNSAFGSPNSENQYPKIPHPHLYGGFSSAGSPHKSSCSLSSTSKRKIAKSPYKVLDAPALQDDFYLNLVDWSATNVLAVGLGSAVYLWSACTSKVTKLCDVGTQDSVTSVAWTERVRLIFVTFVLLSYPCDPSCVELLQIMDILSSMAHEAHQCFMFHFL